MRVRPLALRGVAAARLKAMFDTGVLLASLLVSSVGFVLFVYGRRMSRVPQLACGLLLMAFPYLVDSVVAILLIATALLALLWGATKLGW